MAKKNTPAPLQADITTDEEWTKILEKNGLVVIDVYSEWSGPCTSMVSVLKKIKMEIGGDMLSYAIARCDNISALERFRGKSEPTWMFIRDGQMVNLMFGAHCPELQKMLTKELQRIQNGEPHEFSIPISQKSPEEEKRLQILKETKLAKEAAKKAQKEAKAKAKYEAEMFHLTESLCNETCLLLYPWIFKDEEGRRRDKRSSPPYAELVEEILFDNYTIAEELRKRLDENILGELFKESDYEITENVRQLLMDGKCMFLRLKINEKKLEMDVEKYLLSLLFGESVLPGCTQRLVEGCYAERHRPSFVSNNKENSIYPVVWVPPNSRSKATVFRIIFHKYINSVHPYEDKTCKSPIIVFKYDSTKRNDLKVVLELYNTELVNFGVFERDKPPNAKQIATSIQEFEEKIVEKTGYEVFICVVRKVGSKAFLTFAGIGPYHVSESPERAIEESALYFAMADSVEEIESDDEDQLEEAEETVGTVNEIRESNLEGK